MVHTSAPTVYTYARCSTCRKALNWLNERGVEPEQVDIVETPPPVRVLRAILTKSGLPIAKLFNTSGQAYRAGNYKDKLKTMSETQALEALAADGKLIKRPLVVARGFALVGFDEARYVNHFAS